MNVKSQHRRNYNEAGHAHELTFSCYHGYPFLKADRTCQWLADSINAARVELDFDLWAFVFMPNHVHLVIRPRQSVYDMAKIRYAIKHPTSKLALAWLRVNAPQWLPRLTRTRGKRIETSFWQSGGGYDRNIVKEKTLLEMIDYIHLNPVRKRLVAQAIEWHWSSAGQYLGEQSCPLRVDSIPPEWLEM